MGRRAFASAARERTWSSPRCSGQHAPAARYIQHVLIEVSQSGRCAVLHDADDLERHVAVADTGDNDIVAPFGVDDIAAAAGVDDIGEVIARDLIVAKAGDDILDAGQAVGADRISGRPSVREIDDDRRVRLRRGVNVDAVAATSMISELDSIPVLTAAGARSLATSSICARMMSSGSST